MNKVLVMICFLIMVAAFVHPLCGDCNQDDEVSVLDAMLMSQMYIDLIEEDVLNCDVDDDNDVTHLDALLVAQYFVELIPELPCMLPLKYTKDGTVQIEWNEPDANEENNEEVLYYNVYLKTYDDNSTWEFEMDSLAEFIYFTGIPDIYVFGVSAMYLDENGENFESAIHSSLDENAIPNRGWYLQIKEGE